MGRPERGGGRTCPRPRPACASACTRPAKRAREDTRARVQREASSSHRERRRRTPGSTTRPAASFALAATRPLPPLVAPLKKGARHAGQVRLHQVAQGAALPLLPDLGAQRRRAVRRSARASTLVPPPLSPWRRGTRLTSALNAAASLRSFLARAYPTMKKNNPDTPIMLREAAGTLPNVYARYGPFPRRCPPARLRASWPAVLTRRLGPSPPHPRACDAEFGHEEHQSLEGLSDKQVEEAVTGLVKRNEA